MPLEVKEAIQRVQSLKSIRDNWESHWQEISELVLPRRSDFVGPREAGDKRGLKAVDSTAIIANELLAAGLHGMLTNPASRWFTLKIANEDLMAAEGVKEWLEDVERRIFSEFNSSISGFTSHMHELYLDLTAFGTSVMFIGETEKGELTFSTRHLKECFLAEDPWGLIDTVYRKFDYTVRQILTRWPDNPGAEVQKLWDKKKYDDKIEVLHCVYPRRDRDPKMKTPNNMPIASVYMLMKFEHTLAEGGFEEMPYVSPRWIKAAGETYGRGPGMNTLPDVKMLQEMAKTIIKAAQKVVDPPLQAEDDSVLGPVRTTPGGLNFRRPGSEPISPLVTGARIDIGLEMTKDVRQRIREGFFIDQLQLNTGPQMTATEVLQRTEEKLRLLGPVLGRLQSELLSPMIQRVFGILMRLGKLRPPPEVLTGVEYTVEYVSPLARAQRQVEANALLRVMEIGAPLFQIDPATARVVNGAETIRWLADLFGIPASLVKSKEELDQILAAEQAQARQQQELALLAQGATAAKDAGGAAQGVAGAIEKLGLVGGNDEVAA
jgi:hypothetical protein